jgi:hypothetical protein
MTLTGKIAIIATGITEAAIYLVSPQCGFVIRLVSAIYGGLSL